MEAFAKVNRSLRILGARPDGFHELDTIFQTIDLTDRLTFEPADELVLEVNDPLLPSGEENLVIRAAQSLARISGTNPGARIFLEKRIPHGAGLGGGSGDAAATFRALCVLWKLEIAEASLNAIAAEVGSDVPFFLLGGKARGRGRGEWLEPLEDEATESVVLLTPPFSLSTADVYGRLRARRNALTPIPLDTNLPANELEPAAEEIRIEVRHLREALDQAGALGARLSGSGSTVFGIFRDLPAAQEAVQRLTGLPGGTTVRIVPTVSREEFARRSRPEPVS